MDAGTAGKLYKASWDQPILGFEDVFITGILAKKAGVQLTDHPAFGRIKDGKSKYGKSNKM